MAMCDLPHEVCVRLLTFLPLDSRAACAVLSRTLRDAAADDSLWRSLSFDGMRTSRVTPAALRSLLMLVTLGLHPTTAVVDLVIAKAEHVDHALAVDEDVVITTRGKLPIGAHSVKRASKTLRQRALRQLEAANIALRAHWLAPAAIQLNVGESNRLDHACYSRTPDGSVTFYPTSCSCLSRCLRNHHPGWRLQPPSRPSLQSPSLLWRPQTLLRRQQWRQRSPSSKAPTPIAALHNAA
jgi:hypothetical protein